MKSQLKGGAKISAVRRTDKPTGIIDLGKRKLQETIENTSSGEKEKPEDAEVLTDEDYREANSFDFKKLQETWMEIAQAMTGGSGNLFTTLTSGKLEMDSSNYLITFSVVNDLQKEEMLKLRPKLLKILKTRLKNKIIQINIKILPAGQLNRKPYLPKEKFEYMAKINPNLKLLRDKLNLDYD
jgi:hypothetical protein